MNEQNNGHEHEFEPELGLPEPLPANEKILWQGAPDFLQLAVRVFHVRKLIFYFLAILVARVGYLSMSGLSAIDTAFGMVWPTVLALTALAAVFTLAWLTAKTTVYTLTDQRVVMRIGIVLTLTFNLPLRTIVTAGVSIVGKGFADIPLALRKEDNIAWLHLWPHTRPWRVAKTEPMLRCIPNGQHVANLLSQAWSRATGISAASAVSTSMPAKHAVHWQPSLS
jgi:hypothetical protein